MDQMTIKILLVDESPIFRLGLKQSLPPESVEICGEAADGLSAQRLIRQKKPDVVLLSAELSDIMTTDVSDFVSTYFDKMVIIFLINHENFFLLKRLIFSAAKGFITRNSLYSLNEAIKTVMSGRTYLQPDLGLEFIRFYEKDKLPKLNILTDREYQTLVMLTKGKTVEEIAVRLHKSIRTIFNVKASGFKKLSIDNLEQFQNIILNQTLKNQR